MYDIKNQFFRTFCILISAFSFREMAYYVCISIHRMSENAIISQCLENAMRKFSFNETDINLHILLGTLTLSIHHPLLKMIKSEILPHFHRIPQIGFQMGIGDLIKNFQFERKRTFIKPAFALKAFFVLYLNLPPGYESSIGNFLPLPSFSNPFPPLHYPPSTKWSFRNHKTPDL